MMGAVSCTRVIIQTWLGEILHVKSRRSGIGWRRSSGGAFADSEHRWDTRERNRGNKREKNAFYPAVRRCCCTCVVNMKEEGILINCGCRTDYRPRQQRYIQATMLNFWNEFQIHIPRVLDGARGKGMARRSRVRTGGMMGTASRVVT